MQFELKGRRLYVSLTLLFSVFTNLLMLTGPLFMLQVYDRVLGSRSEETLVALFGLVAVLYGFYGILEHARGRVMARLGARLSASLDTRLFRAAIERAALRKTSAKGTLQDLDTVRALFSSPVLLAFFDVPWTPLFLVAIFLFHPLLGATAVVGGGLLVVIALLNQVLTSKKTAESTRLAFGAQAMAKQSEDGADLIWAQGMLPAMATRWADAHRGAVATALSAADRTGSFSAFTKAFRLFLQSAMLALGAWLVLRAETTPGAIIASSIMLGRALQPIELGISQWAVVQRARVGWKAIRDLLGEIPDREKPTALPAPVARLDVTCVTVVARRGEAPILQQVSLSLAPGEAIGVIGRSGSGKTTLARIIVGIALPVAGDVRLGGATLDQYGPERLGGHIGYLPQDVRFFEGTVAENIARMALNPDASKVVAAARKARVHDIVLRLPHGYDTRIGAADAHLSGGQRQRLALARALYDDPVLLVLDEPNSALDAEGSEALNAVVLAMKREGKGILIMTHRPTAISSCDKLLVLDGGKVSAFGPRDEVIKSFMKNAGDIQRVVAAGHRP